jgi:hypothetical protein
MFDAPISAPFSRSVGGAGCGPVTNIPMQKAAMLRTSSRGGDDCPLRVGLVSEPLA